MAEQTNVTIIEGNLVADPETRQAGKSKVTRFRLASNRTWKDDKGEKQQRTTFVEIEAWNGLGEVVGKHLKKGRHVLVQGRLELSEWKDDQDKPHSKLFINAENVRFLGAPEKSEEASQAETAAA